MGEKTNKAKRKLFDRVSERMSKIASLISAALVILGALTGIVSWATSQFTNAISSQINEFREEVRDSDKAQDQAITRLELMNLIQTDPTNTTAIEKMARYYFHVLDGDLYMTQKFSDWAREYGGDISIVIGVD